MRAKIWLFLLPDVSAPLLSSVHIRPFFVWPDSGHSYHIPAIRQIYLGCFERQSSWKTGGGIFLPTSEWDTLIGSMSFGTPCLWMALAVVDTWSDGLASCPVQALKTAAAVQPIIRDRRFPTVSNPDWVSPVPHAARPAACGPDPVAGRAFAVAADDRYPSHMLPTLARWTPEDKPSYRPC